MIKVKTNLTKEYVNHYHMQHGKSVGGIKHYSEPVIHVIPKDKLRMLQDAFFEITNIELKDDKRKPVTKRYKVLDVEVIEKKQATKAEVKQ